MKSLTRIFGLIGIAAVLFSCEMSTENKDQSASNQQDKVVLSSDVITKDAQAALTPDMVIKALKDGNERFMKNELTPRDYPAQVRKTTNGQYPEAIILACVDSRVPVENVFDKGVGDVFVARVAGNFVNEDILGSMEFATKVSGSKVVLVLGHEHCGAVKSAIDDVKLGNITPMLAKIKPAVEAVKYDGDRSSKNKEFVHDVCTTNVQMTIDQIRKDSPIMKEMEDNGEIKIVGAVYDLDNGKVTFLN